MNDKIDLTFKIAGIGFDGLAMLNRLLDGVFWGLGFLMVFLIFVLCTTSRGRTVKAKSLKSQFVVDIKARAGSAAPVTDGVADTALR